MLKVEEMTMTNEFTIGAWLISSDLFHPAWNQWVVCCVTLAGEINGKAVPTRRQDFRNTHEVSVLAVDPAKPINYEHEGGIHFLQPPDQVIQIIVEHDAAAREKIESVIKMIENKQISPDSDFRSRWELALGGKTFYSSDKR